MRLRLSVRGGGKLTLPKLTRAIARGVKRATLRYYEMVHEHIDSGRSFTPRTGNLQQSILWQSSGLSGKVYANKKYAPFVELGTRPRIIRPRRAKALAFTVEGKLLFASEVKHPGSRPYPFMFADLQRRKREIARVFREEIKRWLT